MFKLVPLLVKGSRYSCFLEKKKGGGDGFLCRLLRDYEINCFVKDTYAVPIYAQAFTSPNFEFPDMVTAFEVFEHFVDPEKELDNLFLLNPKVLLVSTELYANAYSDWWYLSPHTGQHVFFYSKQAFSFIAKKYGYDVVIQGGFILFLKKNMLTFMNRVSLQVLLKPRFFRILLALLYLLPTGGVLKDYAEIQSAYKKSRG